MASSHQPSTKDEREGIGRKQVVSPYLVDASKCSRAPVRDKRSRMELTEDVESFDQLWRLWMEGRKKKVREIEG